MARTPSKRWEKMVETHCLRLSKYGRILDGPAMLRSEAATLLSSQHAAFVRLVKDKMPRTTVGSHNYARKEVLKEILAALQQGGKRC